MIEKMDGDVARWCGILDRKGRKLNIDPSAQS